MLIDAHCRGPCPCHRFGYETAPPWAACSATRSVSSQLVYQPSLTIRSSVLHGEPPMRLQVAGGIAANTAAISPGFRFRPPSARLRFSGWCYSSSSIRLWVCSVESISRVLASRNPLQTVIFLPFFLFFFSPRPALQGAGFYFAAMRACVLWGRAGNGLDGNVYGVGPRR